MPLCVSPDCTVWVPAVLPVSPDAWVGLGVRVGLGVAFGGVGVGPPPDGTSVGLAAGPVVASGADAGAADSTAAGDRVAPGSTAAGWSTGPPPRRVIARAPNATAISATSPPWLTPRAGNPGIASAIRPRSRTSGAVRVTGRWRGFSRTEPASSNAAIAATYVLQPT